MAGYSYVHLALTFRSDGSSFTYLDQALPWHPNIGGLMAALRLGVGPETLHLQKRKRRSPGDKDQPSKRLHACEESNVTCEPVDRLTTYRHRGLRP